MKNIIIICSLLSLSLRVFPQVNNKEITSWDIEFDFFSYYKIVIVDSLVTETYNKKYSTKIDSTNHYILYMDGNNVFINPSIKAKYNGNMLFYEINEKLPYYIFCSIIPRIDVLCIVNENGVIVKAGIKRKVLNYSKEIQFYLDALKAVQNLNYDWKPAIENGHKVTSFVTIPIYFDEMRIPHD